MKKQVLIAISTLLLTGAANAAADCGDAHDIDNCDIVTTYTGMTTFAPSIFTNMTSESSSRHHKEIVAAKQDADAFIASNGQIYGAYLAQAFESLRSANPAAALASDLEIAQAILAY